MAEVDLNLPVPGQDRGIWGPKLNAAIVTAEGVLNDHDDRLDDADAAIAGLEEGVGPPTDAGLASLISTDGTASQAAVSAQSEALIAPNFEAAQRAAQLRPRDVTPWPSPPTLTYSHDSIPPIASAVQWGIPDGPSRLLSCAPVLTAAGNLESGYVKNTLGPTDLDINRAPYQDEVIADGDFALNLRAFSNSPLPRVNLYIEDRPCQTDPQSAPANVPSTAGGGTTALATGTNYYTMIPHPSPGTPLHFRVQIAGAGLRRIEAAPGTTLQRPTKPRPKIAIFGTSFSHNTGSTARYLYSWVWMLGELLGAEIYNFSRSGAGYIGDGTNTIAAQVARAAALGIDFAAWAGEGSGNDGPNSASSIEAAASAVFADLAALWPSTPGIVIGMGARGSVGETSDVAANIVAGTRAAALAAPTVVAFHDPIGTVTSMPTYTTGATYAAGDIVRVLGSAARARAAIASAPATVSRGSWELLSHLYGTGYVGATTGDGNRDTAVDTDGLHPTAKGARLIAARYNGWITDDLRRVVPPA